MPFEEALRQAAALGFARVDVVALSERPGNHLDTLADTGALVGGVLLGHGLAAEQTLDAEAPAVRKQTLDLLKRQVADGARLGATCASLVCPPSAEGTASARFRECCQLLADFAAGRQVRLCVRPQVGGAQAALAWLEGLSHPDLALQLDTGACLRAGEDPAAEVRRAGPRLGAVSINDTDGAAERLPLFAGRWTPAAVERLFSALREIGYRGAVSLDLDPRLEQPVQSLEEGRATLQRILSRAR
jgi:sugar phosphate isomerase/epimerase